METGVGDVLPVPELVLLLEPYFSMSSANSRLRTYTGMAVIFRDGKYQRFCL